jgi:hypothetical protein
MGWASSIVQPESAHQTDDREMQNYVVLVVGSAQQCRSGQCSLFYVVVVLLVLLLLLLLQLCSSSCC